jgi:hypothetical protein
MKTWDGLTRGQKIAALARGYESTAICPGCGREVHVVSGYITQHTDPSSWTGRQPLRQCPRELTALLSTADAQERSPLTRS